MPFLTAHRTSIPGPPLDIHCPACHARGVPSKATHYEEPLLLVHLIPLLTLRNTFVECGACGSMLVAKARDLAELYHLPVDDRSARLRPYVSWVGRFLVVTALLLFWFPFLAPPLAIGGLVLTWRHAGWRRAAVVAVVLTSAVAAAVAALFVVSMWLVPGEYRS